MKVPYFWLKDYINTELKPKEVARLLTMAGHALDKPIENEVMDFEDRGNRADVMGIIGLARDLAALTGTVLKTGTVPKIRTVPILVDNRGFQPKISVESEKVIRWTAVTFKNIKIQPSLPFVAERLAAYGLPLINNIVDLTNFVMVELGMPLHAFDLDRVSQIILRPSKKGESLVTFEGTKLELDIDDLVAADDKNPLTLTTAVGGRASGISESTKNILVEAGLYHQPTARRSAIKHNVRNETSNRLGKYLHPQYCPLAIERFVYLMKDLYDYDPEPSAFDYFPESFQKEYAPKEITLTQSRLNLVAGEELTLPEASKILNELGFVPSTNSKVNGQMLNVKCRFVVPYFRTDVTMEDDLIEEVLRIRGYDKLPTHLPQKPAPDRLYFPEMDLENRLRDAILKLGFNEVVSQPIVDVKDSQKILDAGSEKKDPGSAWQDKMVFLENSWNQELNLMRPEMLSGQLKYLLSYQKHIGQRPVMLNSFQHLQGKIPKQVRDDDSREIRIFEIGKTYTSDPSKAGYAKYLETRKVVLTTSGDYLNLKAEVETLLSEIGIREYKFSRMDFIFKKFRGASITVSGQEIGKMGEVKNSVLAQFNIKDAVSHAVFYIDRLVKVAPIESLPAVATDIVNYIVEDLTLTVGEREEVDVLLTKLRSNFDSSSQISFVAVFQNTKLKSNGQKSVTFNLKLKLDQAERLKKILLELKNSNPL